MTQDTQNLLRQALQLGEDERAEIAAALLESLDPPADAGVEEAWRVEVARRLADIEAGAPTIPWEEVRDQLYAKLRLAPRD